MAERRGTHNHQVPVSRAHHVTLQDERVVVVTGLYTIRIEGHLGPTALSAFPSLVSALQGGETVMTGLLADRSALYGVIGQIEALGLELIEVRRIGTTPRSPPITEPRSIGGRG
jgi:hypothetical protein